MFCDYTPLENKMQSFFFKEHFFAFRFQRKFSKIVFCLITSLRRTKTSIYFLVFYRSFYWGYFE